ncbi:hypothetical protein [Halolamina sediminis]|jgi:hypothetical protein|uniref:hypothetical protein n=1 Tax=Halolamina sediminis TaxID=1480675 RepID=UPI001929D153|nr:hypothetical protein [Halolamina sediminis]
MSSSPGIFDDVAWERFLRIGALIAFVTATFVFTASEILPGDLSTIAIGAIGSVGVVTAIIGFLIAAASTFDHAEERAEGASNPEADPNRERDESPRASDSKEAE